MRATLAYALPQEHQEFVAALEGMAARCLVREIDERCRLAMKHGEPSQETRAILEEIRQMIRTAEVTLD